MNRHNWSIIALFIIYFLLLTKFILFKNGYQVHWITEHNIQGRIALRVNLHPFQMIHNYLISHLPVKIKLANIIGNIVGFMPMGVLLPLLMSKKHSVILGVVVPMFLSTGYEVVQFITGLGSTDIDDVILNTLGALCGFLLYQCFLIFVWIKNKCFYYESR